MTAALGGHTRRLAAVCAAMLASVPIYGAVAYLVPSPDPAPIAQGGTLLWLSAILAAFNVVTLTPGYRAMLAGPLRVFAERRELAPLLAAHLTATVVVFARLEAVAMLGLLLYFLTGRRDWFWAFAGVAMLGMVALWPFAGRVREDLAIGPSAQGSG